jgi:hypothetical protein
VVRNWDALPWEPPISIEDPVMEGVVVGTPPFPSLGPVTDCKREAEKVVTPRELEGTVGTAGLTTDTPVPVTLDELDDDFVIEVGAAAKSPVHVGSQLLV